MNVLSFLGLIAGPRGFFGPGFWQDFKEGWEASTKPRPRTEPAKSASPNDEWYLFKSFDLTDEDRWDFPEGNASDSAIDEVLASPSSVKLDEVVDICQQ